LDVPIRSSGQGASVETPQNSTVKTTKNPPSFPLLFFFFLFELHRHDKKAFFGTSMMAVDF